MVVQMKLYEKQCIDYAEKYKRNWEYYCLVKDAWLAGYKQAKVNFSEFESEQQTLDISNGEHQIGERLVPRGKPNGEEKTSN